MFQLLGSLFRLFIDSSSPQQIIISISFISFTESEQLSYPSEGVIRKKQANIVATVRGAVQPDKPRLPLQTQYYLSSQSAGHLLQLLPLDQLSVTVSPIRCSRP